MRRYQDSVSNRTTGLPVNRATVYVYKQDVSGAKAGLAQLYLDDGVTTIDQPIFTDSNGLFVFYVADGTYTITISGNGLAMLTFPDIEIYEADGGSDRNVKVVPGQVAPTLNITTGDGGKLLKLDSTGTLIVPTDAPTAANVLDSLGNSQTAAPSQRAVSDALGSLLSYDDLAQSNSASGIGTTNGPLQPVLYSLATKQPTTAYGLLASGANRAYADVYRNFFDAAGDAASGNMPRIRPTDGGSSIANVGLIGGDQPRDGSWWQMTGYLIAIYNRWKLFGDESARLRLALQAAYLKANYTIAELGGDGTNFSDGKTTINSLDDGGWVCLALGYLHEATQDFFWLRALRSAIPAILRRFADTFSTPIVLGQVYDEMSGTNKAFQYSPYGCQYDTGTDAGHGTASFEQIMALASLYVYDIETNPLYLLYAQRYWEIDNTYFTHSSGNDIAGIGLDPSNTATYLKSTGYYYGYPQEGVTNLGFGATVWMGLLSARLYERLGTAKYLTKVQTIAASIVKPQGPNGNPPTWPGYGTSGFDASEYGFVSTTTATTGVFLQMSDPWSDGLPFAMFAAEALTLPNVDPSGVCKGIIRTTAASIVAQRASLPFPPNPSTTIVGCYTADWGGPLLSAATAGLISGYVSYQAHYAAVGPEAGGQQIMPNSAALCMVMAGALVESWGAGGLPTPVATGYDASQALATDDDGKADTLSRSIGQLAIINKTFVANVGVRSDQTPLQNAQAINAAYADGIKTLRLNEGDLWAFGQRLDTPDAGALVYEGGGTRPILYMPAANFNNTSVAFADRYAANAVGIGVNAQGSTTVHPGARLENFIIQCEQADGRSVSPIAARNVDNLRIGGVEVLGFGFGTAFKLNSIRGHWWVDKCLARGSEGGLSYDAALAPQITAFELDNDVVNDRYSVGGSSYGCYANITLSTAFSDKYGFQSDGWNIADHRTEGFRISDFRADNVGEAVDCFGTRIIIKGLVGRNNPYYTLKFIHGASQCIATAVESFGAGRAALTFAGGSGSSFGHGAMDNQVIGLLAAGLNPAGPYYWSGTTAAVLITDNGGTRAIDKPSGNRVSSGTFTDNSQARWGWYDESTGDGDNIGNDILMRQAGYSTTNPRVQITTPAGRSGVRLDGTDIHVTAA